MNIKMEVVYSIIYAGSGFVVGALLTLWLKGKKNTKRQTSDARKKLRNIYSNYLNELHSAIKNIDGMLEALEK